MGRGEFQRTTRAPPERDVVPVLCSAICISEEERWLGAPLPDLIVALFPVTWKPQRKGPRPYFYGSDLRRHETCVSVCLDPGCGWSGRMEACVLPWVWQPCLQGEGG